MRNASLYSVLLLVLAIITCPIALSEPAKDRRKKIETTEANIAMHDEIFINSTLQNVWGELLKFPFWFVSDEGIERVEGRSGHIGDTQVIFGSLLNQIIAIRPLQSVVWKACFIESCDKDYIFYDLGIEQVSGKVKFSKNYYSQGFWSEEMAREFIREQEQGVPTEFMKQISTAFKAYIEKGVTRKEYLKNLDK